MINLNHKKTTLSSHISTIHKNPQQHSNKPNSITYKNHIHNHQVVFTRKIKGLLNIQMSINVIYYMTKIKKKKHMIISINGRSYSHALK